VTTADPYRTAEHHDSIDTRTDPTSTTFGSRRALASALQAGVLAISTETPAKDESRSENGVARDACSPVTSGCLELVSGLARVTRKGSEPLVGARPLRRRSGSPLAAREFSGLVPERRESTVSNARSSCP